MVRFYAVGFGFPTTAFPPGAVSESGPLPSLPACALDTGPMTVISADLISPGLFQLNAAVPAGTPAGDHAIGCQYDGFGTNGLLTTYLTVGSSAAGAFPLQGESFVVDGSLTLGSKTLSYELQAVPSGAGHSITFDDDLSVASGVTITFSLGATVPTVSGDTLTYSGTPSVGLYQDLSSPSSPVTATITSVTIVLSVPSPANGGAVTGTISLTTSAGTFKGSLTGTLSGVS